MSNGIDFSVPGIAKISSDLSWLAADGRLHTCIAKPPRRLDGIPNDEVAPASSAFAEAILGPNQNGTSNLETWFAGGRGLLLFPEYAFSSKDFPVIDAAVRGHGTPLIVLAGFGAVTGADLTTLLDNDCSAAWQGGANILAEHGRYNCGWCWIHEGPGHTRCTIFCKNYVDQTGEITELTNVITLNEILRIETDDAVFYPLICSDLISTQAASPRMRIGQSLPAPENGKRCVICTISCNVAPRSHHWRAAIDAVVQMHQQQAVVLFANQAVTSEYPDEDSDRWRCLTGAFISHTRMLNKPRSSLPTLRYVRTEGAAGGLVVRHPDSGIATGLIGWDNNNAGTGLYVWQPAMRLAWSAGEFTPLTESTDVYEIRRFVGRRKTAIVSRFSAVAQEPIANTLGLIASEPSDHICPRLWPELLDGLTPAKPRSPDDLYQDQEALDSALGIFAAVQNATAAQPIVLDRTRGQLAWNETELRVWRSPQLRDSQMLRACKKMALDSGSAPPLIIIGRGSNFGAALPAQLVQSPAQKATPERQSDITQPTVPQGSPADIQVPRPRTIFWQQMGTLEELLADADQNFAAAVRNAITDQINVA